MLAHAARKVKLNLRFCNGPARSDPGFTARRGLSATRLKSILFFPYVKSYTQRSCCKGSKTLLQLRDRQVQSVANVPTFFPLVGVH